MISKGEGTLTRSDHLGAWTILFVAALAAGILALLVAGPWARDAAAATRKPDLVVSNLSNPPIAAAPEQTFSINSTVKNAGSKKAASSTMRFYLSQDASKGASDTRFAAEQAVQALRPKKIATSTTELAIPASAPFGKFYLLACADDLGQVREKRESNNCRAAATKITVGDDPFEDAPEFSFTPDPLTVTPTLEESRAVTQKIPAFLGGTVTTTAADGTKYTLTLPANALLSEEEITMTPVSGAGNLPGEMDLAAGVDIKPDGLQLMKPAKLTIEPPTGAQLPLDQQTGLSWHGGGEEFHLYAIEESQQLSFELLHFSAYGVGLGTSADRAAALTKMPTRTADQYRQAISELLRSEREAQLKGEPGDPDLDKKLANYLAGYYRDVVRPKMLAAETDDSLAASAIQEGLGWSRQVELLGLSEDPFFAQKEAEVMDSIIKILQNAFNKAFQRCVNENDPSQVPRLLALERQAQLLGISLGDVFDKINRCARFELDFEASTQENNVGALPDGGWSASAGVRMQGLQINGPTFGGIIPGGSKAIEYTSWNIQGTGECHEYTPTGTDVADDPFEVLRLGIKFNVKEEMSPDGRTIRTIYAPEISMPVNANDPNELSTHKWTCGEEEVTHPNTPHFVYTSTLRFLNGTGSSMFEITDWSFQGGSTWATKTYSKGLQADPNQPGMEHGGTITYTLRHVPQP